MFCRAILCSLLLLLAGGQRVRGARGFTLVIDRQKISGKAANAFSAAAVFKAGGQVSVDDKMMATKMMPPPHLGAPEKHYFRLLKNAENWRIADGRLQLVGSKGKLIFKAL